MRIVRYNVRAIEDGKVVFRKTFKVESTALDKVRRQLRRGRRVIIRKEVEKVVDFKIITEWGISDHDPWMVGPKPLNTVFVHTSVTKQLPVNATIEAEKEQMRVVDSIAHARGFNGISYGMLVPPSGRTYKGRGFGIVEAATEGFNTSSDSICTLGNTDAFEPTKAQVDSIVELIKWGQRNNFFMPKVDVRGHREVAAKSCPGAKFSDSLIAEIQRRVNA